jgi:type IV pilus assembly protein PilE
MVAIQQQRGFTITELMVVAAIIGILLSIAIPSYNGYVQESRQNDGRDDVYRVMAQQERYFLKNMTYTGNLGTGGIGYNIAANADLTSPEGYFLLNASLVCDNNDAALGQVNTLAACVKITATGGDKVLGTVFWLESDGDKSANL